MPRPSFIEMHVSAEAGNPIEIATVLGAFPGELDVPRQWRYGDQRDRTMPEVLVGQAHVTAARVARRRHRPHQSSKAPPSPAGASDLEMDTATS